VIRTNLLLCSAALFLAGCASSDKSASSDSRETQGYQDQLGGLSHLPIGAEGRLFRQSSYSDIEVLDIQNALSARGLYLTSAMTVDYLNGQQCGLEVYAHRGHYNYPENASSAILMGALSGFDGVEIDVMLTRDGYWVAHHDSYTGRATGRVDGKRFRMSRIDADEWNTLVMRNKDGQLTTERPPYAIDAFNTWNNSFQPGQQLNIEIKEDADIVELNQLLKMVRQTLPTGSYFFSSMELDVLKDLRQLDKKVYLGYVWEPHPTSIEKAKALAKKAAKSDVLYQKYQRQINWVSDYESRSRSRSKSQKYSAKTVLNALGPNSGLHVDIRSFVGAATIYTRSHQAGLDRVATYSINGTEYHQSQLSALKNIGRPLPNEAIMDTSKFEVCQHIAPQNANQTQAYTAVTPFGEAIMTLPNDADFGLLKDQIMYLKDNHYLAVNGRVRLLSTADVSPPTTPVQSNKNSTKKSNTIYIPKDEDLSLESSPISIEIPE
jgi:glycerophosphoryl diester phosphodiesterase